MSTIKAQEKPAIRYLRAVVGQSRHVFDIEDARNTAIWLGFSEGYMHQLLHELVQEGWLFKIRRGLYGSTGRLAGYGFAHDYAIATRLVEPSALCRFTALSYHEMTTQVPFQAIHVMTPKNVVTPGMRSGHKPEGRHRHAWVIGRLNYEYYHVKPEHFFGIERVHIADNLWVPMTDRERTALDLFVAPSWAGTFGTMYEILKECLAEDLIDVPKLVRYAVRYAEGSLVKRLGWCLEELGVSGGTLSPLLQYRTTGYRLLDPDRLAHGSCNKRWMIVDNLAAGYEEQFAKTS